ncbi:uncharacterized protein N0V96_003374 [Colletotrichum fioriniae]|uniref:uncharacterized protein n=1 Tax=Colletotrichum fioriniae TaxID=710243 RepID=UPI0032DA0468|nr:hypothetical protein N0V96_003374 [Colletotrichum fioriniae]
MAVPQEKVAVHTTVASIALPEKAAYSKLSDTIATTPGTLTPVASTPEKSLEMPPRQQPFYPAINPFDTDIEAMITTTSSSDPYAMKSISTTKDCPTIWPGKQDWKAKAKAAKRDRGSCACMARMSKKNRIIMKVAIGLLVIGVGVGVGFGVSKPLGAPIWGTPDGNK